MEKLVSIIIPCYNGAKTVGRCLASILDQTYSSIEVIVVNDGSTDNSAYVISQYIKPFENAGIKFHLINQANKGLAGAINAGLAVFSGSYLCWIDCDDYLFPESLRKRVEYLESHPDIAVVTSDAYFFNENDLEHPIKKASDGKTDIRNPNQFENHLRSKAIFCCGCHMVRSAAFLDVIPSRQIYPARRGQNWQMLLPIYYKYNQAFLDEPLYAYILYQNSMSAGDNTKEQYLSRYNEYLDIILHTLDSISMPTEELKKYQNIYFGLYYRQLFYLGVSFHDYSMIIKNAIRMKYYKEWKREDTKWFWNLVWGQIINKLQRGK